MKTTIESKKVETSEVKLGDIVGYSPDGSVHVLTSIVQEVDGEVKVLLDNK